MIPKILGFRANWGTLLLLLSISNISFSNNQVITLKNAPKTLSEWGLATVSDNHFKLSNNVQPYALATPLFTDYALKLRAIRLPNKKKIHIKTDQSISMPVDTVLMKNFYYQEQHRDLAEKEFSSQMHFIKTAPSTTLITDIPLKTHYIAETRLLIKQQNGWLPLIYLWNNEQTEATLSLTGGISQFVLYDPVSQTSTEFDYVYPDANQCTNCHGDSSNVNSAKPIGIEIHQLNTQIDNMDNKTVNQLQMWLDKNLIANDKLPRLRTAIKWNDKSVPTTNRARAYLASNCGHCHRPHSFADNSGLFLDTESIDDQHLGICKQAIAAGRGTGGQKFIIAPGHADESSLIYRMTSIDAGIAMPEMGRSLVHQEGIKLVSTWVNELETDCSK